MLFIKRRHPDLPTARLVQPPLARFKSADFMRCAGGTLAFIGLLALTALIYAKAYEEGDDAGKSVASVLGFVAFSAYAMTLGELLQFCSGIGDMGFRSVKDMFAAVVFTFIGFIGAFFTVVALGRMAPWSMTAVAPLGLGAGVFLLMMSRRPPSGTSVSPTAKEDP